MLSLELHDMVPEYPDSDSTIVESCRRYNLNVELLRNLWYLAWRYGGWNRRVAKAMPEVSEELLSTAMLVYFEWAVDNNVI